MKKLLFIPLLILLAACCNQPKPATVPKSEPAQAVIVEKECKVWRGTIHSEGESDGMHFYRKGFRMSDNDDQFISRHWLDGVTCENWDQSKSSYGEPVN